MPQDPLVPLSDEEVLAVADDPEMVRRFTSEERRRLTRLKATAPELTATAPTRGWVDVAVDTLPMVGGALGGVVGGIGGTVAGMGVGGVPGAVGGAALGGSAGEAIKQLTNRARGAEAPATPGDAATAIGLSGGVNAAMELGGQVVPRALTATGRAVYRGYLKPSLAKANVAKARGIVDAALKEAIPITESGVANAGQVIRELRTQVDELLAKTTGRVDVHQIADRVRAFAKGKYFKPGVPTESYDAALKVADSIDAHPSLNLPAGAKPTRIEISLSEANQMKRGIDTAIGESNFGLPGGSATRVTQKVGRRTLRQAIEQHAPDVGPINAREGLVIDARQAVQQAVGREQNRNQTFGVPSLFAGAVGGAEYARTRNPYSAAATALALRAGLHPAIASRAAIVAFRLGQKMSGAIPANISRIALQAVLEAQQEAENGSHGSD